ncbi:ComF family protein [Reichenbachiella sp. MALMAid0571]|uniref:ComF family protein n=1 Tax=Reichenbachiella sp. MALMAid0571 TaxID=3143939 RepID=UPI0032DFB0F8
MKRILTDFLSLFYPRACICCNRTLLSKEEYICMHCRLDFPLTNFSVVGDNPLRRHLLTIENLDYVFAYLKYVRHGAAQKILHELKYRDQKGLGIMMGQWLGYYILEKAEMLDIDLIIPIPLHKSKLRKRGYNQSALIAEGLSKSLGINWEGNILERKVYTSTQTKKGKTDRWVNVDNIFQKSNNKDIKNQHILLIDDVITTGATIESAAKILTESGVGKISIACIATGQQ